MTATSITPGVLATNYNVTGSFASVGNGLTVTLPSAGTYLITGFANITLNVTGIATQYAYMNAQIYNTTTVTVVPNSLVNVMFIGLGSSVTSQSNQLTAPIGPIIYTVAGATQIDVQFDQGGTVTINSASVNAIAGGGSVLSAVRIA